jgi:LPS O-antigen subunit length determinant protein (WzzB/FepE family)
MADLEKNNINLFELIEELWNRKFFISIFTFLGTLIAVLYALYLPNIYKSVAILTPANDSASGSSMLSQYSGMANLAGISLPSGDDDQVLEAIERIKSYDFFYNSFLPSIALQDLMAIKEWKPVSNKLIYKEEYFDSVNDKWIRKVNYPKLTIPSAQESFEVYKEIMTISKNKSFIQISIEHQSPFIAQKWTGLIITEINRTMRFEEKSRTSKSIDFLNNQSLKISYEDLKQALASLLQEQMKSLMLIEASEDYVFKVISSPLAPELKSEPKRSLIVVMGFLGSLMLSLIYILIMQFIISNVRKAN